MYTCTYNFSSSSKDPLFPATPHPPSMPLAPFSPRFGFGLLAVLSFFKNCVRWTLSEFSLTSAEFSLNRPLILCDKILHVVIYNYSTITDVLYFTKKMTLDYAIVSVYYSSYRAWIISEDKAHGCWRFRPDSNCSAQSSSISFSSLLGVLWLQSPLHQLYPLSTHNFALLICNISIYFASWQTVAQQHLGWPTMG